MSVIRLPPIGSSALRMLIGIVRRSSSIWVSVPLVVDAQPCRYSGEEGIVVLRTRGVRGVQHPSERELEDVVVPGHVALGHDGRQRVGYGLDEVRKRLAGREGSVTVSRGCRIACVTSLTAEVR